MPISLSVKDAVTKNNIFHFTVLYDTSKRVPTIQTVNFNSSYIIVYYTDTLKLKARVHSILFNIGNKQVFNNNIKLKSSSFLFRKIAHSKYDSLFWSENPIIKRTPLENNATKIFEKKNLFGTYKRKP